MGHLFSCLETLTHYGDTGPRSQLSLKGERREREGGFLELRWWEGFLVGVVELSLKALSFGVRLWLGA